MNSLRMLPLVGFLYATTLLVNRTANAAVVDVNKTLTWSELNRVRVQTSPETTSPLAPRLTFNFIENISLGPVTLSGGDTLKFNLRCATPLSIKFNQALDGTDFTFDLVTQTSLFGNPNYDQTLNPVQPPVSSMDAINIKAASNTGTVSSVALRDHRIYFHTEYDGQAAFLTDPTQPGFITGIQGSIVLPESIPTATFDSFTFTLVSGAWSWPDPAPPLITIVPEPIGTTALALILPALLRRPRRIPAASN